MNKQYKEIEENNRMGKIKDLFRKIGDIKGTFHARMGSIKDKNGKDLTNKRLRRGLKSTHKNCNNKVLMTLITMMVWSLTESWTSWSLKSNGT